MQRVENSRTKAAAIYSVFGAGKKQTDQVSQLPLPLQTRQYEKVCFALQTLIPKEKLN